MATGDDLRRLALGLDGTIASPHFDRTAFKVMRIYATLAADGHSANLKLSPDEQQLKCTVAPDAFSPVDNAWGAQGWTSVTLKAIAPTELAVVLEMAWRHAGPKQRHPRRS